MFEEEISQEPIVAAYKKVLPINVFSVRFSGLT
jgi:hypothetical protein